MWSCWIALYGVFVVGYELPLLWNNLLTPRKEIKSETNPLWSIKVRWQNVDVSKGFDKKIIILEIDLSISMKPQWYAPISVCLAIGIYAMVKVFPLVLRWQYLPCGSLDTTIIILFLEMLKNSNGPVFLFPNLWGKCVGDHHMTTYPNLATSQRGK